jgi:MFS transporter, OFA family, oxalate/formate antiporter
MTDMVQATASAAARVSDTYRWTQLVIGVAAMVMIANYQYGWTFFVPDIQKTFGWDRASIQWAFTLFVLFETWLVPVEGWFVDKYGPRVVVLIGGILCAVGWAINAHATTLNGYYLGMIVAGIGAGGVYGTCVGNALKWFPDKRGLAAGITAADRRRLCSDGCADPGDDQRFWFSKHIALLRAWTGHRYHHPFLLPIRTKARTGPGSFRAGATTIRPK